MWKSQVKETFFDVMPNLATSVAFFVKREVIAEPRQALQDATVDYFKVKA